MGTSGTRAVGPHPCLWDELIRSNFFWPLSFRIRPSANSVDLASGIDNNSKHLLIDCMVVLMYVDCYITNKSCLNANRTADFHTQTAFEIVVNDFSRLLTFIMTCTSIYARLAFLSIFLHDLTVVKPLIEVESKSYQSLYYSCPAPSINLYNRPLYIRTRDRQWLENRLFRFSLSLEFVDYGRAVAAWSFILTTNIINMSINRRFIRIVPCRLSGVVDATLRRFSFTWNHQSMYLVCLFISLQNRLFG